MKMLRGQARASRVGNLDDPPGCSPERLCHEFQRAFGSATCGVHLGALGVDLGTVTLAGGRSPPFRTHLDPTTAGSTTQ